MNSRKNCSKFREQKMHMHIYREVLTESYVLLFMPSILLCQCIQCSLVSAPVHTYICIVNIVYKPLQFPLFHVCLIKEVLKHRRLRLQRPNKGTPIWLPETWIANLFALDRYHWTLFTVTGYMLKFSATTQCRLLEMLPGSTVKLMLMSMSMKLKCN